MSSNHPRATSDAQQPARAEPAASFEALARDRRTGLLGELLEFLRTNKKWWLAPILLCLLLLGLLVVLGGSAAAPFIYTLF